MATTALAMPRSAWAEGNSDIVRPAYSHPMAFLIIVGIAMTIVSFIAGHTRIRSGTRWFDFPILIVHLLGIMLVLKPILINQFGTGADRAWHASCAIIAMGTVAWIGISYAGRRSPWRSMKIASFILGCALLMMPAFFNSIPYDRMGH